MKIADILDELAVFQGFPYGDLATIAAYLNLEQVPKGEVIFSEGDPGTYLLILCQGRVAIFKGGEHGSQLLSLEERGRIVGEMALLDHESRSASCIADTDCELLILSEENLKKLAAEHSAVAYRLMLCIARLLSRRLRRASGIGADFLGT